MRLLGLILVLGLPIASAADLRGARVDEALDHRAKATFETSVNPNSYLSYYIDLPSNVDVASLLSMANTPDVELLVRQGEPHTATTVQGLIDESVFVGAGTGNSRVIEARRNGSPPLTPGRWWITLANLGAAAADVTIEYNVTTSGAPFVIDAGLNGTWYEPATTYQGAYLEILQGNIAIAVWFTFTPEGEQAYLIGSGPIEGDRIVMETVNITSGGRFGQAFRSQDVVQQDWGDIVFTFDSCDSGYLSFLPSQEGWPAEQLRVVRLTSILGLGCPAASSAEKATGFLRGGSSGAWFDPNRVGEGWLMEIIGPDLGFVYWFTYTPDGKQAWFGNVGQVIDGTLLIDNALQPIGGRFGPDYDPDDVTLQPWGSFAITITGCSSAAMASVGPSGWGGFGTDGLARLTQLAGTDPCDFAAQDLQLQGSAVAQSGAVVDGDLNNPDTPLLANNTPAQVQPVTNPGVVSGFLAAEPTGVSGDRFASSPDLFDAYRANLTEGQVLQLVISDWQAADATGTDLDLAIYAAGDASEPVQGSFGTTQAESIRVNQTGSYDIVVSAYAGHSNYTLSIGNGLVAASSGLLLEDEVLEGEVLVRLKPEAGGVKAFASSIGLDAGKEGLFLHALQLDGAKLGDAFLKETGARGDLIDPSAGWGMGRHQATAARLVATKALRAHPSVKMALPNYLLRALATPNDPGYPLQFHYPQINLPQAWDVSAGDGAIVAVVDTGVSPNVDLAENIRYDLGFDAISNLIQACDGDGRDFDARDPGDGCGGLQPSTFHGTHVAGTVAAVTNNGLGVSGVAYEAKVMPVRVLGRGGGSFGDIMEGVAWAAGLSPGSPAPADVINLSLGGVGGCPSEIEEVFADVRAQGAIVVAAAGNDNSSLPFFPASCANVVSVSAVDRNNLRAYYSNCGSTIDVAAPGGEANNAALDVSKFPPFNNSACADTPQGTASRAEAVLSLVGPGVFAGERSSSFDAQQGTSMASPHVAGVAALMKSVYPPLTPAQFDALLTSGALTRDLAGNGASVRDNEFGYGLIDAFKAVSEAQALVGGGAEPTAVVSTPSLLAFGDTATQLSFQLGKEGAGSISVQSVTSSSPWLQLQGGGANGLGSYTASVSRSGLPEAEYSGTIVAALSTGSNVEIPVNMRVGSSPESGESTIIYALLIDAITGQLVAQGIGGAGVGAADFSMTSLPGRYFLIAGSDNDNDFFICDAGETCGVYPDAESFEALELRQGRTLPGFLVPPDTRGIGQASTAGLSPPVSSNGGRGYARRR